MAADYPISRTPGGQEIHSGEFFIDFSITFRPLFDTIKLKLLNTTKDVYGYYCSTKLKDYDITDFPSLVPIEECYAFLLWKIAIDKTVSIAVLNHLLTYSVAVILLHRGYKVDFLAIMRTEGAVTMDRNNFLLALTIGGCVTFFIQTAFTITPPALGGLYAYYGTFAMAAGIVLLDTNKGATFSIIGFPKNARVFFFALLILVVTLFCSNPDIRLLFSLCAAIAISRDFPSTSTPRHASTPSSSSSSSSFPPPPPSSAQPPSSTSSRSSAPHLPPPSLLPPLAPPSYSSLNIPYMNSGDIEVACRDFESAEVIIKFLNYRVGEYVLESSDTVTKLSKCLPILATLQSVCPEINFLMTQKIDRIQNLTEQFLESLNTVIASNELIDTCHAALQVVEKLKNNTHSGGLSHYLNIWDVVNSSIEKFNDLRYARRSSRYWQQSLASIHDMALYAKTQRDLHPYDKAYDDLAKEASGCGDVLRKALRDGFLPDWIENIRNCLQHGRQKVQESLRNAPNVH